MDDMELDTKLIASERPLAEPLGNPDVPAVAEQPTTRFSIPECDRPVLPGETLYFEGQKIKWKRYLEQQAPGVRLSG